MSEAEDAREVFAVRLQGARSLRKMSQQDLAAKTGLPASSISHFEGKARRPSFENLRRLANALNVTTDYLIGRTEEVGTSTAAQRLNKYLDKLNDYDLDIAERFIEVLAQKEDADGER
jgi:transcriptional regulator with XRE-family HTH domain